MISYSTMMGLAAQSSRWKIAMEDELAQLAKTTAEALAWNEAAGADHAAAAILAEKSAAEQAESELLEEEADSLITEGTADKGDAVVMEGQGDGLALVAAQAETESDVLLTKASAQEVLAEQEVAKALANTELAAEASASAGADEAGTAICQFIPFVDFVCDVVGGLAAVGLESQAVRAAALSAEEYGSAAALQFKIEATAAHAAELQAKAAEDGEQAGVIKSKAAALEAKSEEELLQGEADEAAARAEFEQSELDRDAAEEEEAKSLAEEDSSAEAWSQSVKHGANACRNAIMMSFVSLATLLFWVVRVAGSLVLPLARRGAKAVGGVLVAINRPTEYEENIYRIASRDSAHTASHVIHHVLFVVLFFGLWGESLLQLRNMKSASSMGGILLGFACSLAALQVFLLHAAPRAYHHDGHAGHSMLAGICEFSRLMIVMCPLVIMEILLLWVNGGPWVFRLGFVDAAQQRWIWGVLVACVAAHHWLFSRARTDLVGQTAYPALDHDYACNTDPSSQSLLRISDDQENIRGYGTQEADCECASPEEALETSQDYRVVSNESKDTPSDALSESKAWSLTTIQEDASRIGLLLVFEVLMASIMLAFLRQSLPALLELWPASKSILLSAYPHWHLMVGGAGFVGVLLFMCAFM